MMLSLGTIVYLAARTLPRIDDREPKKIEREVHWFTIYVEKIDVKLRILIEKLLHRTGRDLLKAESSIQKKIVKIQRETEAQENKEFFVLSTEEPKELVEEPKLKRVGRKRKITKRKKSTKRFI